MTTTRAVADFTGTRGSKQGEYGLSGILVGMSVIRNFGGVAKENGNGHKLQWDLL